MPHATISSKGQITLPLPVREKLRIKKGDICEVEITGNEVTLSFQKASSRRKPLDLSKWLRSTPGVFGSQEETDTMIRNTRDTWEK